MIQNPELFKIYFWVWSGYCWFSKWTKCFSV